MKLSNKTLLNLSSFIITFSLGTIFSLAIYTYLFANHYLSVRDTPPSVVKYVCGADEFCRGKKHDYY
jgi:uncharacterized membrane protein YdjX (TVP38/TMEM64 family)